VVFGYDRYFSIDLSELRIRIFLLSWAKRGSKKGVSKKNPKNPQITQIFTDFKILFVIE